MTKEKDIKTVVPTLRFPEFRDTEEWEVLYGCNVFDQISNKNHNSDLPILAISQEYGAIPRDMIDYNVVVTDKSIESYKVVDIDDFIISLRSFQGGIEYSSYQGLCSPAYIVLRKKIDINNQFFKYYFKSYMFIQDLNKNLEGIRDGKMISYKQFSEILLPVPIPSEQKKIANCLDSLDNLINAVANKIETLKEYKKGLMQQLFPAEGKTIPAIRFPEFQNAEEWQTVSLGDVATFINGRAFKQDELLESGKYRVLRVGNFFSNANWYHSDLELDENKYCDKGDLLYAWSASFGPRIWNEDKVIFHYHIWKVVEKEGISKDFLLILLDYETERIKNQQANGLGLLHITKGAIESWKTRVPMNILEQQKIAKNLSSVDELIITEIAKLDQLKAHKKGLMQQLFPKL